MKRPVAAIGSVAVLIGLAVGCSFYWKAGTRQDPTKSDAPATESAPRVESPVVTPKPEINLNVPNGFQAVKIRVPPDYLVVCNVVRRWAESRINVYTYRRAADATSYLKLLLEDVYVMAEKDHPFPDGTRASVELTLAVTLKDVPKLEDAKQSSELCVGFVKFKDTSTGQSPKKQAAPNQQGEFVHTLTIVNGDRIESVEYRKDSNTGKLSVFGAAQMGTR